MASIHTLADDIKGLFGEALVGNSTTFEESVLAQFGSQVALHVADTLTARTGTRKPNTLYMSEIGTPCVRKVWYGVHHKSYAEPMQEHALFKFLYGDVIEEIALLLAEAAGHKVEDRQKGAEIEYGGWKIRGRRDATIDGVLVDVKSCSPYGFKKFREGLNDDNDSFGYRHQLSGYNLAEGEIMHGMRRDQGFLAIDKQNGHIGFFEQPYVDPMPRIEAMVQAVDDPNKEPHRSFKLIPEGMSGNARLGTECAYCPYKVACWRDANDGKGLRGFAYSTGPMFLGTIKKEPKVAELTLDLTGAIEAGDDLGPTPEKMNEVHTKLAGRVSVLRGPSPST